MIYHMLISANSIANSFGKPEWDLDWEIWPLSEDGLMVFEKYFPKKDADKPIGQKMAYAPRGTKVLQNLMSDLERLKLNYRNEPEMDQAEARYIAPLLVAEAVMEKARKQAIQHFTIGFDRMFKEENLGEIARMFSAMPSALSVEKSFVIDRIRKTYPDVRDYASVNEWGNAHREARHRYGLKVYRAKLREGGIGKE